MNYFSKESSIYYVRKVFKNGSSEICWKNFENFKSLKWCGLLKQTSNFLKPVFHKFYLVHSWILSSISYLLSLKSSSAYHEFSKIFAMYWMEDS